MGRVKALMMEMEEAQFEEADASFNCPVCKHDVDGSVELPVVYDNGNIEHLPVCMVCADCDTSFDGWVRTDWHSCEIELDDYPDIEVKADPVQGTNHDNYDDGYYEWLAEQEYQSRSVYSAFCQTIGEVKELTAHMLFDKRSQMLARMLLAQSITALEVFLADTLIVTVTNNKDAQRRLLTSKRLGIGSAQIKIVDTIDIENFAKDKLLEHLRGVSFHNLQKVKKLFEVGLKIDILPEGEPRESIMQAIKMRHDCVHRNGMDRETNEVHQIDAIWLLSLSELLLGMVTSVDEKVNNVNTCP